MKYLRALLLIILAMFTFGSAMAQVVVRARVGPPVHRRYYHHRHYYWRHHHRYWR
jgi:hypothetical protein